MDRICITGAGGFIGSHLARRLKREGCWVRGVDLKKPEWSKSAADEFLILDLRHERSAWEALDDVDTVFALASDMGGMGYISANHCDILRNNARINLNTARAACLHGVGKVFFSSSACVYPECLQMEDHTNPLRECDAWRGRPDTAYGSEKLFGEDIFLYLAEEHGTEVRIARFHNIYGPEGDWTGGREKLPAAACRKVAVAKMAHSHQIEIWGDGLATRSFCYIDDCLEMVLRLMESDYREPLNIGTDRLASVDEMYDIAASAAGISIEKVHIGGPQGVRSRNANLELMRQVLDYEPAVTLEDGMAKTYEWIEGRVRENLTQFLS